MKKKITRILSILFLFLLLLNPALSIQGAKTGLLFWFETIIPTLLPFIIVSNLIVQLGATKYITFFLAKLLKPLGGISDNGCYVVLIGLLCGYPMGAKTSSDMVAAGKITAQEGQYLIAFANHASPMFLLGFVLTAIGASHKLFFLSAYYLPVLILMLLSKKYYKINSVNKQSVNKAASENSLAAMELTNSTTEKKALPKLDILDKAINDGFEVILKVGGHIILFSIIEAYFERLPISNHLMKSLILGSTEITTGIVAIGNFYSGQVAGELLALTVCAFGGFSGLSQTKSVLGNSNLAVSDYFMWKALHGLFSAFLFLLFLKLF